MLRINRQTDYAFRVILFLAKRPSGTRISSATIKQEMLIPPALSLRIIAELAHGEFIRTFPGRDGGIQLARSAEEISMWDVINLFEGPIYLSECLTDDLDCPLETKCPIRRRWGPLHRVLRKELEKITFKDLALETEEIPELLMAA